MIRIIHLNSRCSLARRAVLNIRYFEHLSDWRIGEDAKTMTPKGATAVSRGSPAIYLMNL
jgi:hypothetical protein